MIKPEDKIAQCRYCTNSSNEGSGRWFRVGKDKQKYWMCSPCISELLATFTKCELVYWTNILKK